MGTYVAIGSFGAGIFRGLFGRIEGIGFTIDLHSRLWLIIIISIIGANRMLKGDQNKLEEISNNVTTEFDPEIISYESMDDTYRTVSLYLMGSLVLIILSILLALFINGLVLQVAELQWHH